MKTSSFSALKKKLLLDPAIRKEYQRLGSEFELVRILIQRRLQRGLTQAALAKKLKTKQSAVARLESGSYNPTISFLNKVAHALDTEVVISFIDRQKVGVHK